MLKNPITGELIPNGWSILNVDDIKSSEKHACVAGPFGSDISSKYFVEKGIPVIRGNNLTLSNDKFKTKGFVFVSKRQAQNYKGQHVKFNDLVFTCWGTIGQVGIIPKNGPFEEYIISNKQLKLRVNNEIVNPTFLYYYFSTKSMVKYINNIAIGAAVPGINLGLLKNLPVILPTKIEQDLIAKSLDYFFDLIENNNQRIKLLEEMAAEIYKEWFVRFRFPGYKEATFLDKEGNKVAHGTKGAIPEGWEKKPLDEFDSFSKSDSKLRKFKGDKRYLATANITDIKISSEGEIITWDNKPSRAQLKPELHSVFFARMSNTYKVLNFTDSNSELIEELALTSGFLGLKAKNKSCFAYLFSLIKGDNFHNYKDVYANGATQVSLTNEGFHMIRLIEPKIDLIEKYGEIVNPFFDEINLLMKKNKILQETRDLLLPRLISSKLSVENLQLETLNMAAEPQENYNK